MSEYIAGHLGIGEPLPSMNELLKRAEKKGRADAIDEIHNLFHDRLCYLSNLNTAEMSKNEVNRLASVLSECNKWLDTLEQIKGAEE